MKRLLTLLFVFGVLMKQKMIFGDKIRTKRAHEDNFNILLKLYKMNHLKESQMYNKFFSSILIPKREQSNVPNTNSNESTRAKRKETRLRLKHIEDIIHMRKVPKKKQTIKPGYEIGNSGPESFVLRNDLLFSKQLPQKGHTKDLETNSLLGDIQSGEVENNIFGTIKPRDGISTTDSIDINKSESNSVYVLNPNDGVNHIKEIINNPAISVIVLR